MAASSEFQKWLQQSRKSWVSLTQGALWLGGILGGFLLPPPVSGLASDEKIWLRLGQFIVAVLLGLVFVAARRWNQPRHALRWAGTALLFLVIAVVAFFRYQQLMLQWTTVYSGEKIVIGSVFTPHGLSYRTAHPEIDTEKLVFEFAGKTEEIWTRDSIRVRRLFLAGTYSSCLPLFTICLIAVVQAIQSGDRKLKKHREKQPPRHDHRHHARTTK